jgi:hypothetical protein
MGSLDVFKVGWFAFEAWGTGNKGIYRFQRFSAGFVCILGGIICPWDGFYQVQKHGIT